MKELHEAVKTSKVVWPSTKGEMTEESYDLERGLSLSSDYTSSLARSPGEDFLFLFDLVACTCGKAATLRVLSYTSPSFEQLCQPRILTHQISKTESSVKVRWGPARLQDIRRLDQLEVAEYVATIFPGHMWKTLPENCREVEFRSLTGGTTEYTVTVSAIVGNAKMKGVFTKQFLPPFPPQNLTVHTPEIPANKQSVTVRLTWNPPRGDFHKYSLRIVQLGPGGKRLSKDKVERGTKGPDETWLPRDATEYVAEGLRPGVRYQVELWSMTDVTKCLADKSSSAVFLTKPLPPSLVVLKETCDQVSVSWEPPLADGHPNLAGYTVQLRLQGQEDKLLKEEWVTRGRGRSLVFGELTSTREYVVALASVCQDSGPRPPDLYPLARVFSDFIYKTFVVLPKAPSNLRLDTCQPTSLKVKWDQPLDCFTKPIFNLLLAPLHPEVAARMKEELGPRESETPFFTFSRLPDVLGSGQAYEVSVEAVVAISGKSYFSSKTKKIFLSRPLPPTNLVVISSEEQKLGWRRSKSPGITKYKFKIKMEEERAVDFTIEDSCGKESGDRVAKMLMHCGWNYFFGGKGIFMRTLLDTLCRKFTV